MSKPLNGGVRSHALDLSSLPFNSLDAFAFRNERYPLRMLTASLASNDPKRIARLADDVQVLMHQAESVMRLITDYRRLKRDARDEGLLADPFDEEGASILASSVFELCADALPFIHEAARRAGHE